MTMGNPDSHIENPVWRAGLQRTIAIEAPPVGREWSVVVPSTPEGVWWELIAARFRLTTSAVVANRFPAVLVDSTQGRAEIATLPPSCYWASLFAGAGQPANFASEYWVGKGVGTALSFGLFAFSSWPIDLLIQPGHYIKGQAMGMDAGDQFSGITLLVREMIYVPPVDYISGALSLAADRIIAAVKANGGPCGCPLVVGEAVGSPTG